ncbi:hypothetical protein ACFPL7_22300 [Dongia soli]|uniref:Uncharacterized protein n=1 Tax=Dongia soli TaxID=600628 RepID=A0ABU5E809_9PROT|nr:hypothetical protein [Dongia soli]MDY0882323.1 hypothetical protein [Dongia soli]
MPAELSQYLDEKTIRAGIKLMLLLIGLLLVVGKTRWLDRRAGLPFKDALNEMRKDPRALADYYGRRFLGICLLVSVALLAI